MEEPPAKLRRKIEQLLSVQVVEYHNEALQYIYRMIGCKKMPLEGNCLVHFDSHPDLLVPRGMPAEVVFNKEDLFCALQIESWILPAVYAGHFKSVIWLKQEWCQQIPEGRHIFNIGKDSSGEIRVDCTHIYFIGEGLYCKKSNMENVREVELIVFTINNLNNSEVENLFSSLSNYVLDIDLDYFSTCNPFKELYSQVNLYSELENLYKLKINGEIDNVTSIRKTQIKELESLWIHVANKGVDDDSPTSEKWPEVKRIAKKLIKEYETNVVKIDWELVHDAGCTWDITDLPHHVTDRDNLMISFKTFSNLISALNVPPAIITVSRSSEDEYTPPSDVDYIQSKVIEILQKKYDNISIFKPYLTESN